MRKNFYLLLLGGLFYSQVGINTSTPHVSATLDISSIRAKTGVGGLKPPTVTTVKRGEITTPAEGLIVYNSDKHCLQIYGSNNQWIDIKCDNAVPTATNVSTDYSANTVTIGKVINGVYTYADTENDTESGSVYQWYRADDDTGVNAAPIASATNKTYTMTIDDIFKAVKFCVTPASGTGTSPGIQVCSPWYANQPKMIMTGIFYGVLGTADFPMGVELYATENINDLSIYKLKVNNSIVNVGTGYLTKGSFYYVETNIGDHAKFFQTGTANSATLPNLNAGGEATHPIELQLGGVKIDSYAGTSYYRGWAKRVSGTRYGLGGNYDANNWIIKKSALEPNGGTFDDSQRNLDGLRWFPFPLGNTPSSPNNVAGSPYNGNATVQYTY